MAESDRVKWNEKFARDGKIELTPPVWLSKVEGLLPAHGRALDIAAGNGRLALWLARRGLDVLAIDISRVGLELANQAAESKGLHIETVTADLEVDPLPTGPFDMITCFCYRQRDLFPSFRERLSPGGFLVAEVATVPNLERHAHPSLEYLAEPGELRRDCAPLKIIYYEEGWFEKHASARVVARQERKYALAGQAGYGQDD